MTQVGYSDAAVSPHREGHYALKLARSLTLATDDTHELAIRSDDDDPLVQSIQNQQVAGLVEARLQSRPEEGPLFLRVRAACAVDLRHVQGQ